MHGDKIPDLVKDPEAEAEFEALKGLFDAGTNCIKIGLPGKLILSKRKGLREARLGPIQQFWFAEPDTEPNWVVRLVGNNTIATILLI